METITTEQTIEKIIENFDFDKVHKVMQHLNWTWNFEKNPPTVEQLKKTAATNLKSCCSILNGKDGKKRYNCSSGGFVASARKYKDGEICLELSFQITSFNWSTKDTCY